MARPFIATKLYVPKARRPLVARPRLRERLEHSADARLTLVSAPPGFGKTTLVAEWLGPRGGVAWVSLDAADNDPNSFWTYVLRALGMDAQEAATSETAVTAVVNELAASPEEVWLVLDDFHVITAPDITASIGLLLERLPPQAHVVISTRADPDLPLARWRARGELVEIRAADLRFRPGEAAAYLNDVAGLGLAEADVAVLEQRTEGWIAALQLAVLSLERRDDVGSFIARFAGTDRYIVDYLVEEVLEAQPDDVRSFLLQTSVLDRLTGSLCDAVTGRGGGTQLLEDLERANLFLVPLDDRREWFRYHHLFADVLRARLPTDHPEIHLRASRWYEEHDQIADAIRHALAAGDIDRAAHLVEAALPMVRREREDTLLIGWLRSLTEEVVRRSPVLSVWYGWMLMVTGDLGAVEPWFAHGERALGAVTVDTGGELRRLPATIAVFRAGLSQAVGDVPAAMGQARHALAVAEPDDHFARGGAAGFLAIAEWTQGDVHAAIEHFAGALASMHAAGNLADELTSTVAFADMWLTAGRPSTARRQVGRALDRAGRSRAAADLHVALGEIELDADDLDAARRHLDLAVALDERIPMTENRSRLFVARARLAAAGGDPEQAVALLDQAERIHRPGYLPALRPVPAVRARIQIARGELDEAEDWARQHHVSDDDEPVHRREFEHLTLVRLLIARRQMERAARLLARLVEAAEPAGRVRTVLEAHVLRARLLDAQGRRAEAADALAQARAATPEPAGHARLFLDEDAPRRPQLPDPLSEREVQVLERLASDRSGPDIAGDLFISLNTFRTHTKRIFMKLGVTSRREAVSRARDLGLL